MNVRPPKTCYPSRLATGLACLGSLLLGIGLLPGGTAALVTATSPLSAAPAAINQATQPGIVQANSQSQETAVYIYLPLVTAQGEETILPGACLRSEEAELARLINNYRKANGLARILVSKSLTTVAQWHVLDLHENNPDRSTDERGLVCNMHSWSEHGAWSSVCYTSDHAYAAKMWNKPREITNNAYSGDGFESTYGSFGRATATSAFNAWKNSLLHNTLILERGDWAGANWQAMGIGVYEHHAVLWFGSLVDPQGTVPQCSTSRNTSTLAGR